MTEVTLEMQDWVRDTIQDFSWWLGAGLWEKHIDFEDTSCDDNSAVGASIQVQESYQRVMITVYPPFWAETRADQVACLLHELIHVLTNPVKMRFIDFIQGDRPCTVDEVQQLNERETSTIERLLCTFLDGKAGEFQAAYRRAMEWQPKPVRKGKRG